MAANDGGWAGIERASGETGSCAAGERQLLSASRRIRKRDLEAVQVWTGQGWQDRHDDHSALLADGAGGRVLEGISILRRLSCKFAEVWILRIGRPEESSEECDAMRPIAIGEEAVVAGADEA